MYELQYYDHEQDMAHGIFAFAFLHVQLVFVNTFCLEKVGGGGGGEGVEGGGGGGGERKEQQLFQSFRCDFYHCANEPDLPSRLIKHRR